MSTFGESAGVHTASEGVVQTADDSDPLPSRGSIYQSSTGPIPIQERAWGDPTYDDASQDDYGRLLERISILDQDGRREQERRAEQVAIIQLTVLADQLLSDQSTGERRTELRTPRARLVRERMTIPAFDTPFDSQSNQPVVMSDVHTYFFVDYERITSYDEAGKPQYYAVNWSSQSDKIASCHQPNRFEAAQAVYETVTRQLGDHLPAVETPVPKKQRRFPLGILLNSLRVAS